MERVKRITQILLSASMAGFLIGIGGIAFIACNSAYIGALLFCVGLVSICTFKLRLFTGRVGYMPKTKNPMELALTWIGNFAGACICAKLITCAMPEMSDIAAGIILPRLAQNAYKTLILSFFCGVLMYVSVDMYNSLSMDHVARYFGILLCIPAFILCGFEHSVADMFYFTVAGRVWYELPHILLVTLGNALGSIIAYMFKEYEKTDTD